MLTSSSSASMVMRDKRAISSLFFSGFGQVDHRGDLVGIAQNAWLVFLRFEHLQPRHAAEKNQQGQQNEGAPKKTELDQRASGGVASLHLRQWALIHGCPSGTKT
jgi:hypothetical protein